MSELKALYIQGMESHLELVEFNNDLTKLHVAVHNAVSGNEAYQEVLGTLVNGMGSLGGGLLTTVGWIGGKTVTAFANVLGGAGNLLSKAFSDNDVLIRKIMQQFSRSDTHELKISKDKLKLITSDGQAQHISRDLDLLSHTLEIVDKHAKAVLDHLDARMGVLREMRNAKTTEDVYKIIDKHDALKYPILDFGSGHGPEHTSDKLPGGKVMVFDETHTKYLMNGDTTDGSPETLEMSKSDVSSLLTRLDKVNGMHKRFKANFESYLRLIKSWGDMVKAVEPSMEKMDKVSKSALKDVERLLGGDSDALAFYSGFTPRVISYTDRYIHGVLGVFV